MENRTPEQIAKDLANKKRADMGEIIQELKKKGEHHEMSDEFTDKISPPITAEERAEWAKSDKPHKVVYDAPTKYYQPTPPTLDSSYKIYPTLKNFLDAAHAHYPARVNESDFRLCREDFQKIRIWLEQMFDKDTLDFAEILPFLGMPQAKNFAIIGEPGTGKTTKLISLFMNLTVRAKIRRVGLPFEAVIFRWDDMQDESFWEYSEFGVKHKRDLYKRAYDFIFIDDLLNTSPTQTIAAHMTNFFRIQAQMGARFFSTSNAADVAVFCNSIVKLGGNSLFERIGTSTPLEMKGQSLREV